MKKYTCLILLVFICMFLFILNTGCSDSGSNDPGDGGCYFDGNCTDGYTESECSNADGYFYEGGCPE